MSLELPVIGTLPDSWKVVPFGEVLAGGTRNGIYKKKEFHGRGAKIVNMGELFGNPRLFDVEMKRVELTEKEIAKAGLEVGDLLFARRSLVAEGAGKCSLVCEVNEPTTFESSIIRARPDPSKVDSYFLYYLFSSPFGKYILGTIRRTVAVSGITGTDLVALEIPVPPIEEQRAIASILEALDDKIELNRRMNATLESLARAIFKSWFVDFDPVHVNAGLALTGQMPASSAIPTTHAPKVLELFPSTFQDSELGPIPEGWQVEAIENVVETVGGATPSTKKAEFWEDGTLPWATPKDLSGLQAPVLTETDRRITELGADKISSGMLPVGTVLMSSRAPVGYLAIATIPVAINQGFIALKPNERASSEFILNWCKENMDRIKRRASGTTFQEISKKNFRPMKICLPPEQTVRAFTNVVQSLYDSIINNVCESMTLARQRDSLLPQLLSGKLESMNV